MLESSHQSLHRELSVSRRMVICVLAGLFAPFAGCGAPEVPLRPTRPEVESADGSSNIQSRDSHRVRIAAAADLKFALNDIIEEYQKIRPDTTIQATYGASGTLFAQLTQGAPFDLFLSADLQYPHKLAEQGNADPESEFRYAVGHLVVWVSNTSKLDVEHRGIEVLTDPQVKTIAIANPKHAPYGRAAEAALKSLKVYDQIQKRLVLGENVTQTAQFIESGAADIGLISFSLARSSAMRDRGRFWKVPVDAYPKLEQGGVILKQCQDLAATQEFRAFLTGAEGGAILKKFGFVLPGE